ncbi:MAG TPA: hypothetical protein VD763_08775 [Candidatus Saccharimonadales bacterium]|nr:hypothetical protein [Candidatus Saccharimonadales bacterium]
MLQSLGRRLRIAFDRDPADPAAPAETSAAVLPPLVEFVAYAEDCLLSGRVRLGAERLTDMLNAHDEYQLVDVLVEPLASDGVVEVTEIVVRRDELVLVHATGPRGVIARRQRMRPHPLALQLGPYHVRGYLHALPGTDPLLAIRRRTVMVPLTEASVEMSIAGQLERRQVGTVVLNREQIDWVLPALDDEVQMPEMPLRTDAGPLVKDFTGQIRAHDFGSRAGS